MTTPAQPHSRAHTREDMRWDVNNCCEPIPGWFVHVYPGHPGTPGYTWALSVGEYSRAHVVAHGTGAVLLDHITLTDADLEQRKADVSGYIDAVMDDGEE